VISLIIPHAILPGKAEILKNYMETVRGVDETIIVANDKMGYGWACNRGAELASGDYFIISNDDILLTKGTFRSLPDPASVVVPLIEPEPRDYEPRCFFCIPRWAWEKIGGFDERFEVGYFEDDDMILRLKQESIPVTINYQVEIHHIDGGGTTLKQYGETELMEANRARFEEKWNS
jgi:GT2 family glycosyltransferase